MLDNESNIEHKQLKKFVKNSFLSLSCTFSMSLEYRLLALETAAKLLASAVA
jgi:hypothetical protein